MTSEYEKLGLELARLDLQAAVFRAQRAEADLAELRARLRRLVQALRGKGENPSPKGDET